LELVNDLSRGVGVEGAAKFSLALLAGDCPLNAGTRAAIPTGGFTAGQLQSTPIDQRRAQECYRPEDGVRHDDQHVVGVTGEDVLPADLHRKTFR